MVARLVVSKGPLAGTILDLEGEKWTIGRDGNLSEIPIADEKMAPSQAVITQENGVFYIVNKDSAYPILLNGKEISDKTSLKEGDVLRMGANEYTFSPEAFPDGDNVFDFSLEDDSGEGLFSSRGATLPAANEQVESEAGGGTSSGSTSSGNSPEKKQGEKPVSDEDLKLADSILASAQQSPPSGDVKAIQEEPVLTDKAPKPEVQSEPAPVNKPAEEPKKPQRTIMEENEASSNSNQQPSSNMEPASQGPVSENESPEQTKEESSAQNEESSQKEDNTPEVESSSASEEASEEPSESSSEDSSEGEKQTGEEKAAMLAPFNVQDLFRFDQGIFPAEIDDLVQKSVSVDLSQPSRFVLKVLAGANIGAEFHLDTGKSYILGSDASEADIVFNDLSVSKQHAKVIVGNDGAIMLEDLGSKNGVIVEGKKIENNSTLSANQVVALGTTLFLLVDHLAPSETIAAAFAPEDYGLFGRPQNAEEVAYQAEVEEEEKRKRATLPAGSFILTLFIGGLAVLFGIGTASLFSAKEVIPLENVDAREDLERILKDFPSVRYTFNKSNGQLFLIGHVKNSIDKSELLYKVDALSFVKSVDDNVVDDEAIWQEMNILLSKRPEFKGISMQSPEPGVFVISGYLKTEEQAACLSDYLNVHFSFLSLLENKIVVESHMLKAISGHLLQSGFANIHVGFVNGEVVLTGYVNNGEASKFRGVVEELSIMPGVRLVKNFVVLLPAEEGIVDLNMRYPGRYRVTGCSKYGDVSINVAVNGRILTRGDIIDGMKVTSIQPHCIFLEKEGLKYKIEYNK